MTNKILLVDDEESILFAMTQYLTEQGYQVDQARDRGEAEALLEADGYSIVITDLRLTPLGDRDGLDVIRQVRSRRTTTRVILLTAYGSPQIDLEAHQLGADVVLSKPIPLAQLVAVVRGLLGQSGAGS